MVLAVALACEFGRGSVRSRLADEASGHRHGGWDSASEEFVWPAALSHVS